MGQREARGPSRVGLVTTGSSAGGRQLKWATGGQVSPRLGQYKMQLDGVPTYWEYRGSKARIHLALRDSSLLLFAVRASALGRVEVRTTSQEVMTKMRERLHGLKCGKLELDGCGARGGGAGQPTRR